MPIMSKPASRPSRVALAVALTLGTLVAAATAGFGGPLGSSPAVAQYEPPPQKVTVCHHTQGKNGTKHVTITVAKSAVASHLKHGDTLGRCTTTANQKAHAKPAHVKKFHKAPKAKKSKASVSHGNKGKGKGKK